MLGINNEFSESEYDEEQSFAMCKMNQKGRESLNKNLISIITSLDAAKKVR